MSVREKRALEINARENKWKFEPEKKKKKLPDDTSSSAARSFLEEQQDYKSFHFLVKIYYIIIQHQWNAYSLCWNKCRSADYQHSSLNDKVLLSMQMQYNGDRV